MSTRTDAPLDIEHLIRPSRAVEVLNESRPMVYKMVANGILPSVSWSANGKRPTVRIRLSDLRKFIESHRNAD